MRLLLYSDVHANFEALQAMIESAAGKWDLSACLGDVVGYGASPNESIAAVRAAGSLLVRGNHDRACSTLDGIEGFNSTAAAAALWTHRQLSPDNLGWLRALATGPLHWHGMVLAHGSPGDEDAYITDEAAAATVFAATQAPLLWVGHTHLQGGFVCTAHGVRRLETALDTEGNFDLRLQPGTRYLLNPGSVGQPRDRQWRAAFALYDEERRHIVFRRAAYPLEAAQARLVAAGLPAWLAERLGYGM